MTRARKTVNGVPTLANIRASLARGERVFARVRRDAEAFVAKSRGEILKEVRQLERRMLKGVHAATQEQVMRLERRIARLEEAIAALQRPAA